MQLWLKVKYILTGLPDTMSVKKDYGMATHLTQQEQGRVLEGRAAWSMSPTSSCTSLMAKENHPQPPFPLLSFSKWPLRIHWAPGPCYRLRIQQGQGKQAKQWDTSPSAEQRGSGHSVIPPPQCWSVTCGRAHALVHTVVHTPPSWLSPTTTATLRALAKMHGSIQLYSATFPYRQPPKQR